MQDKPLKKYTTGHTYIQSVENVLLVVGQGVNLKTVVLALGGLLPRGLLRRHSLTWQSRSTYNAHGKYPIMSTSSNFCSHCQTSLIISYVLLYRSLFLYFPIDGAGILYSLLLLKLAKCFV